MAVELGAVCADCASWSKYKEQTKYLCYMAPRPFQLHANGISQFLVHELVALQDFLPCSQTYP